MAGVKKGGLKSSGESEYSVIYSAMRGIDLSSDGSSVDRNRFAYAENMYKDYEGECGDAIESVPGFRRLCALGEKIKKIFIYKPDADSEYLAIHAGDKLYVSKKESLLSGVEPFAAVSGISGITDAGGDITAVSFGGEMYFFGGKKILLLSKDGALYDISDTDERVYIPYTYINGKEAEQRNMLTRLCYESFTVGSAYEYSLGTASLTYQVSDIAERACRVTGISDKEEINVFIPHRVRLGDEYYTVTEIAPHAFAGNNSIRTVTVAEGVRTIGKFAFSECSQLASVVLPDSVELIDNACFSFCVNLVVLHLGLGLSKIGSAPFAQCLKLEEIGYASDESDFNKIEGVSVLNPYTVKYGEKHTYGYISIPIFGPVDEIESVTADGEEIDFSVIYKTKRLVESVKIYAQDLCLLDGKEFLIKCSLSSNRNDYVGYRGYMSSTYSSFFDTFRLISLFSQSTVYDGRIFLGKNERHPSLIFYSSRDRNGEINPLYFGEYDYLDIARGKVTRLLPIQGSLAVYTSDGGGCSISYLSGKDTGVDLVPRIYPTEYIHTGLDEAYSAISFLDDQLFLSRQGLIRLEKRGMNLERSVSIISNKVNKALLSRDLSTADMTVWLGYLAIGADGEIFLADPRQAYSEGGVSAYEWYRLTGIGTYSGDMPKFRYASVSDGYSRESNDKCDTDVKEGVPVYSAIMQDGTVAYYTQENGERICVHKTGEYYGGDFSPLCAVVSDGRLLFFGTQSGDICLFNNDKRGIAPSSYSEGADRDFEKRFGKSIDKEYYSFAGHRPEYTLRLKRDDCGIPHLTKSTAKHSMTMKLRSGGGRIGCEIKTDRGRVKEALLVPTGTMRFDTVDFSQFSFDCEDSITVPLNEKEKGWVEKQITLSSREFCSPIAIYNIAYRFRVKGKIKKN